MQRPRLTPRSVHALASCLALACLAIAGCSSLPNTGAVAASRTDELNALRIAKARGVDATRQATFETDPAANAWAAVTAGNELPQLRLCLGGDEWMDFVYVGPGSYAAVGTTGRHAKSASTAVSGWAAPR